MYRSYPMENPARRWRRFSRTGRRLAWGVTAVWFGALAVFFRVAPEPESRAHPLPPLVTWWAADGKDLAQDLRTLGSPAAFALPTPAGFSHALRREQAGLTPPVQTRRTEHSFLPRPARSGELPRTDFVRLAAREAPAGKAAADSGVFPPRRMEAESARMVFPEGWESRLFSGIDLNFGTWTNVAWSAKVELRFDAKGIPALVMLAQSSGLPEVDRRLARSASGWRLLEPAARPAGVVAWNSPAPAAVPPKEAPP